MAKTTRPAKHKRTLFDAIRDHGYIPVIHSRPERAKGALGSPAPGAYAAILSGRRIAVKADSWQYVYAVTHEIAEHIWGFEHSKEMFCEQANMLAEWLQAVARNEKHVPGVRRVRVVGHGV